MRICIYGASDDLVEIDGDLREEFYAQKADEDDGADYVALSCADRPDLIRRNLGTTLFTTTEWR